MTIAPPLRLSTAALAALLACTALVGCGADLVDTNTKPANIDNTPDPDPDPDLKPELIQQRAYGLTVPSGYDAAYPMPLLVALHGLGGNGVGYAGPGGISGLSEMGETLGFFVAYPDGKDYLYPVTPTFSYPVKAWNPGMSGEFATAAGAVLNGEPADDTTYLRALIADVRSKYNIDPSRIAIQGLSNGAFMAYALACTASDLISGVATFAGTMLEADAALCAPSAPVAVMHTHGTADDTVAYAGGTWDLTGSGEILLTHLGAEAMADLWVGNNGCNSSSVSATVDIVAETNLPGAETDVTRYQIDCQGQGEVELWTINGGAHEQGGLSLEYALAVTNFLLDHPKP